MIGSSSAVDSDRLPWLADEPRTIANRRSRNRATWLGVILALTVSLPVALHVDNAWWQPIADKTASPQGVTVDLPPPRGGAHLPAPRPQLATPRALQAQRWDTNDPERSIAKEKVAAKPAPSSVARPEARKLALDDVVRDVSPERFPLHFDVWVGTFATRAEAKKGWRSLMSIDRSWQDLDAAVVPRPSMPSGQMFFRLRLRTATQSQGMAICRQMEMVGQPCIPVGWVG